MQKVIDYIQAHRSGHLKELGDFLAIPSVSTKSEHKPDIERCAQFVADMMHRAGMESVEVISTPGHPVVYGEWLKAPGKPTILIYGHYDVQPVEPVELWESPPFQATERNGNLYARGTADDKGQVHIHLKAIEAHLKTEGKLPVNVKFMVEGEEEVGSEHLWWFMDKYKERLKADALVVSDTSMLRKGVPSITYGLRGLAYYEVEIQGPSVDLHSGVFGGAVPNPLMVLAKILAQFHDANWRVTIPGFYEDVVPLSDEERKQLNSLPFSEEEFRKTVGAPDFYGEAGYSTVERLWCRPTFEINGLWGGYIGEGAKTVIPSKAWAKISTRLVPNQDPNKIAKLVEEHLRRLAPASVKLNFKILSVGRPWVAPYTHAWFRAAIQALEKGFGKKAVFIREGGSIPFVTDVFEKLKVPCLLIGFGLPDENAHAPNEHIYLENYFGGILSIAHLYDELARAA